MNRFFGIVRNYWPFSITIILGLLFLEVFIGFKAISAPFGRDVRIDVDDVNNLYWPVRGENNNCLDCPRRWEIDGIKLAIPFIFENPETEELKLIKEYVSSAVKGCESDFDLAVRLMDYIHKKTEYAASDSYYGSCSYFVLIKSVLQGGRFWCGSMSQAMMTSCLSLGRNARLIHFQTAPDSSPDYSGHYAVEVWLSEFGKWALFDPTINIYYLHHGLPASALEVHNAFVNERMAEIKVMKDGQSNAFETFNDKPFFPEVLLRKYFTHFQIIFRNDFLANGDHVNTINNAFNYYLNWVDDKTPAFYFKQELPAFSAKIGILLFNGIIIVFLSVGLSVNRHK